MPSRTVIAIPARLGSRRLPRKMLLHETGMPLVEHVWRVAKQVPAAADVVVVTDSEEIATAVDACGGTAVMTSPEAASGTARIVEALPHLRDADVIVNLQGDEPELTSQAIELAISLLDDCPAAGMSTLAVPLRAAEDLQSPSVVKAVLTPWGDAIPPAPGNIPAADAWRAVYFSRAAVPAARDWDATLLAAEPPLYWQHVGVYAYRRDVLERWNALPASRLATLESLEQLRVIEADIPIAVGRIEHASRGIDTAADYAAFVDRWRSGGR
jgi:3-deoxy-manno-octulosonate cytidylyltransferase (CMP-KDO synthetase)